MTTPDALYWLCIVSMAATAAILGPFKAEPENLSRAGPWWFCVPLYFVAGLVGAFVGAMIIAPILQMCWQWLTASSRAITWPAPVSVGGAFFFMGLTIGGTAGTMLALLGRRWAVGPKA